MTDRFCNWIEHLFTKHKFMRRFILFWILFMISIFGLYLLFRGGMTEPEKDAFLGLIAMLATGTAFYMWSRNKEDK